MGADEEANGPRPQSSLAGYALAHIARDLAEGVALIDRALALNPNSALAWRCSGWVRVWLAETDLAIEHFCTCDTTEPRRSGNVLLGCKKARRLHISLLALTRKRCLGRAW
jgi:hypothetical protein